MTLKQDLVKVSEIYTGYDVDVLAKAEIMAWRAQNYLLLEDFQAAIQIVFMQLYGVSGDVAEAAGQILVQAAIEHDMAEEVETLGNDSSYQWGVVRDMLTEMYSIIVGDMIQNGVIVISQSQNPNWLASQIAAHDTERWRVHHYRDYLGVMKEMTCMYVLLFGISYENAYKTMPYVVSALKWHDLAEETGRSVQDDSSLDQCYLYDIEQRCWDLCVQNYRTHYGMLSDLLKSKMSA